MKLALLGLVALAGLATGCASNDSAKITAYCQRYAAKHLAYGAHQDLDTYREDLMSSCMAMKQAPYTPAKATARGNETAAY